MNKSIALAADASRLAALLVGYSRGGCALLAPCHPRASTASIDRLIHTRALRAARRPAASARADFTGSSLLVTVSETLATTNDYLVHIDVVTPGT